MSDNNCNSKNEDTKSNKPSSERRWTYRAIFVSIFINIAVIIALGFWYISFSQKSDYQPVASMTSELSEPLPPAEPQVEPKPGETAKGTVNRVLEEQAQDAARRTDEENIEFLKKQGKKLENTSTEASIDQLAGLFHTWVGTPQRASEPVAVTSTNSRFDSNSAQIYDIVQIQSKSGGIEYKAILLDAQGQTITVTLSKKDGEKLYPIFKEIKNNPLMDQIYRKIIMPILDQKLQNMPR